MLLWRPLKVKGRTNTMRRGFTLAELLVAISLSIIILSALYAVYVTSYRSYHNSINRAELDQNARISLERITRDLRQTNQITTALPLTDTDPLNPAPSHIMFQDGHSTTQIQYIEYALSGNNLLRKVEHFYFSSDPSTWVPWNALDQYGNLPLESIDQNVTKADKVSSLEFYGGQLITIKIVVANSNGQISYQTQTLGRNIQ